MAQYGSRRAGLGRRFILMMVLGALMVVASGCAAGGGGETPAPTPTPTPVIRPPGLDSVQPSSGPLSGKTSLVLRGRNFASGASVSVGGVPAGDVTVASESEIRCVTPAGSAAGAADVTVVVGEAGAATAAAAFSYNPLPTVATISPADGPAGGGHPVIISGTGFLGEVSVMFGGKSASGVVVDGTTSISCVVPGGAAAGPVAVVVTCSGSGVAVSNAYRYNGAPTVAGPPTPGAGPLAGGTPIAITGTNFLGTVAVSVGGVAAGQVAVDSSRTRITCLTPPQGTAGPRDVTITASGAGTVTLAQGFTYAAVPAQSAVSPNSGPLAGGTAVTITGSNFTADTQVTVGGVPVVGLSVVSSTQLTCQVPAGAAPGGVAVAVSGPGGEVSVPNGYTYTALPTVVGALTPPNGPLAGGTSVSITGTNFLGSVGVLIGGRSATNVQVSGGTQITCTVPAGLAAGPADVRVMAAGAGQVVASGAYTYESLPTIVGVSPAVGGPQGGGTALTITGSNFLGAVTVDVGGGPATNVVVTGSTTITCVTPPGAVPGAAQVAVNCTSSGTVVRNAGFVYNAAPTITSAASPSGGPMSGGTVVGVAGTGFLGVVTVTVGGTAATNVNVTGGTQLSFQTPPSGSPGVAAVVISCSASGSITLPAGFTYNAPPAVTLPVMPSFGPLAGGTPLLVNGSSFLGTVNVTIGSAAATGVVVISPGQLSCVTPAGVAAGAVPIEVQCSNSGSFTAPNAFTYSPTPTLSGPLSPSSGPQDGLTPLTIRGAGFLGLVDVTIGGRPATNVVVTGGTQIDCLAPPAFVAGSVPVVVTCSATGVATLPSGYTYNPLPTFNAVVSPTSGLNSGGTTLTITGNNFFGNVTVLMGGVSATGVTVTGGSRITCVTPATTLSGPVDVTVVSSTHGVATQPGAFTFIPNVTLSAVPVPDNGTVQGGTPVTLTGANFLGTISVRFNGFAATNVVVNGAGTVITCLSPAVSAGPATLTVSSTTNGSATTGYTFNPAPTIALIVPNSMPQTGAPITITGTNFLNTVSVTVGAQAATGITVTGGTTITCVAPPAATAGAVDVLVTSSSNGAAISTPGLTYNPLITASVTSTAPGGTGPASIQTGDMNRDGISDLLVANAGSSTVNVLLGTGNGTYTAAVGSPIAVAAGPAGMALADVDRDGDTDLVVASESAGSISVLINAGNGQLSLHASSPIAVGNGPVKLAVADFDRDGKLDLAVCNQVDATVSVLLGAGTGAFAPALGSPVAVGSGPIDIAADDLDRDGRADLLVASGTASTLSVLLGNGAGGFTPASGSPIALTAAPVGLNVQALDQDGFLDVVLASQAASSLTVLKGAAGGRFTSAVGSPIALSAAPLAVNAADFDGDSLPDLVAITGSTIQVLSSKGDGSYFAPVIISGIAAQTAFVVTGANRDARPDVAVVSATALAVALNTSGWVSNALFTSPTQYNAGRFSSFTLGDMNRDGLIDGVGSNTNDTGGGVSVALGTRAGAFPAALTISTNGGFIGGPTVADFNRDGIQDLVVSESSNGKIGVFLGDGTGNLPTDRSFTSLGTARVAAVADVDRDGITDIVVMEDGGVRYYRGDGTGAFTAQTITNTSLTNSFMLLADANRDGKVDLVVLDRSTPRIGTFLGNGAGTFAAAPGSPLAVASNANGLGTADLNRDGILDYIVSAGNFSGGTVNVYLGAGNGSFAFRSASAVGTNASGVVSYDANRDGIPDIACVNSNSSSPTVSQLLGNGLGDFPTRTTFISFTGFFSDQAAIRAADVNRDGLTDLLIGAIQISGLAVLNGR